MLFLFYFYSPLKQSVPRFFGVGPVFLGVYLRKPSSKEGSVVYLTEGNLNEERGECRGNGSCWPATSRDRQKFMCTRGFDLGVTFTRRYSFVLSFYGTVRIKDREALTGCFCRFCANVMGI